MGDTAMHVWFMSGQPQEFWRGEARHCGNPGDITKPRHAPLKLGAFCRAAAVVPEDGGS